MHAVGTFDPAGWPIELPRRKVDWPQRRAAVG